MNNGPRFKGIPTYSIPVDSSCSVQILRMQPCPPHHRSVKSAVGSSSSAAPSHGHGRVKIQGQVKPQEQDKSQGQGQGQTCNTCIDPKQMDGWKHNSAIALKTVLAQAELYLLGEKPRLDQFLGFFHRKPSRRCFLAAVLKLRKGRGVAVETTRGSHAQTAVSEDSWKRGGRVAVTGVAGRTQTQMPSATLGVASHQSRPATAAAVAAGATDEQTEEESIQSLTEQHPQDDDENDLVEEDGTGVGLEGEEDDFNGQEEVEFVEE